MIFESTNNVKQEISIMKIIPSILAVFGAAQAGFSGPDTGDCGYASDINDQIVRELGKGTEILRGSSTLKRSMSTETNEYTEQES